MGLASRKLDNHRLHSQALNLDIFDAADKLGIQHVEFSRAYNVDAYHTYYNPGRFAKNSTVIEERINSYKAQGATIRDMESGTLFMLGNLRDIEAAGVLISVLKNNKDTEEDRILVRQKRGDAHPCSPRGSYQIVSSYSSGLRGR